MSHECIPLLCPVDTSAEEDTGGAFYCKTFAVGGSDIEFRLDAHEGSWCGSRPRLKGTLARCTVEMVSRWGADPKNKLETQTTLLTTPATSGDQVFVGVLGVGECSASRACVKRCVWQ